MKKIIMLTSMAALLLLASPAFAEEASITRSKQMININASGEAMLAGTIKSIGPDSLVVSSWGGDWMVLWTTSTKLLRRYDGKASLSEFVAGDLVQVKGKTSTTNVWTINARMIQDNSIQTRNASFSGTISNINGNTFTLTTKKRGVLQVTTNTDVKIRIGDKTGSLTDLTNGLTVSVSGTWNTGHKTLMASRVTVTKKEIKKWKDKNENK